MIGREESRERRTKSGVGGGKNAKTTRNDDWEGREQSTENRERWGRLKSQNDEERWRGEERAESGEQKAV
jgi:hypothetical protein